MLMLLLRVWLWELLLTLTPMLRAPVPLTSVAGTVALAVSRRRIHWQPVQQQQQPVVHRTSGGSSILRLPRQKSCPA